MIAKSVPVRQSAFLVQIGAIAAICLNFWHIAAADLCVHQAMKADAVFHGNTRAPLSFNPASVCSRKQVVAHKGKISLLELRLIAKPHLYGTRWNLFLLNAVIGSTIEPRQLGREAIIIDGDALNASIKQSTAGRNLTDT